jgi:uncharacterized protein YjiS (DUF1127 family)
MNRSHMTFQHAGYARLEMVAAAAAATLRAIGRGIANLYRNWAAARVRRELHLLSDHTLRDIGLTRDQIDSHFR